MSLLSKSLLHKFFLIIYIFISVLKATSVWFLQWWQFQRWHYVIFYFFIRPTCTLNTRYRCIFLHIHVLIFSSLFFLNFLNFRIINHQIGMRISCSISPSMIDLIRCSLWNLMWNPKVRRILILVDLRGLLCLDRIFISISFWVICGYWTFTSFSCSSSGVFVAVFGVHLTNW